MQVIVNVSQLALIRHEFRLNLRKTYVKAYVLLTSRKLSDLLSMFVAALLSSWHLIHWKWDGPCTNLQTSRNLQRLRLWLGFCRHAGIQLVKPNSRRCYNKDDAGSHLWPTSLTQKTDLFLQQTAHGTATNARLLQFCDSLRFDELRDPLSKACTAHTKAYLKTTNPTTQKSGVIRNEAKNPRQPMLLMLIWMCNRLQPPLSLRDHLRNSNLHIFLILHLWCRGFWLVMILISWRHTKDIFVPRWLLFKLLQRISHQTRCLCIRQETLVLDLTQHNSNFRQDRNEVLPAVRQSWNWRSIKVMPHDLTLWQIELSRLR